MLMVQAHLPHFFAEATQSSLQSWCHRGFDNVPCSYKFVPVWAEHGVMRGTVFTAPASRWTDSETLHTPWPPPYQGKTAKFLKWSAFVEDGFLVMRQDGKNDVRYVWSHTSPLSHEMSNDSMLENKTAPWRLGMNNPFPRDGIF